MKKELQTPFTELGHEKFGKNVEIHAIFLRHGEKDGGGDLTEEGRKQALDFGEGLGTKDAIKGYSSPVQRVIETVEQVIKSAPHDKKLRTRIRTELAIPPFSQEFIKKFGEMAKQGFDGAAEWYLSFGDQRPDPETVSPHEIAESFACLLAKYLKMADKLYSGSNIDLINGTHQGLPEALLKEILVRKKDDEEILGFEKLKDIGGALKFTESVEFLIKTSGVGEKSLQINFRGESFGVDMGKLHELAKSYEERTKK